MILDEILKRRKEQLLREKEAVSLSEIIRIATAITAPTRGFKEALAGNDISFICEVKKASPSKGIIAEDFKPVEIAKSYEKAGASAISVLTEEFYFKGQSDYLKKISREVSIPILRKDFIFDTYQIYEARIIGADAILLIAGILSIDRIIQFQKIANSLGLDCLVEVHDEHELEKALKSDCDIIGINNRNLKTFDVDLNTTKTLGSLINPQKIIVSESGIKTYNDVSFIKECGARAVLVGETLMRSENISKTLNELRGISAD